MWINEYINIFTYINTQPYTQKVGTYADGNKQNEELTASDLKACTRYFS
jgi:hypothetical protein